MEIPIIPTRFYLTRSFFPHFFFAEKIATHKQRNFINLRFKIIRSIEKFIRFFFLKNYCREETTENQSVIERLSSMAPNEKIRLLQQKIKKQ